MKNSINFLVIHPRIRHFVAGVFISVAFFCFVNPAQAIQPPVSGAGAEPHYIGQTSDVKPYQVGSGGSNRYNVVLIGANSAKKKSKAAKRREVRLKRKKAANKRRIALKRRRAASKRR